MAAHQLGRGIEHGIHFGSTFLDFFKCDAINNLLLTSSAHRLCQTKHDIHPGRLCREDLSALGQWDGHPVEVLEAEGELTNFGAMDLYMIARRYTTHFFGPVFDYSPNNFRVNMELIAISQVASIHWAGNLHAQLSSSGNIPRQRFLLEQCFSSGLWNGSSTSSPERRSLKLHQGESRSNSGKFLFSLLPII